VASGSLDGTIRLWQVPSSAPSLSVKQRIWLYRKALTTVLSYSAIAMAFLAPAVGRWHPLTRLWLRKQYHAADRAVVFSRRGRLAAVRLFKDGTIHVWDVRKKRGIHCVPESGGAAGELALSADGQILAAESQNGVIRLWNLKQREEIDGIAVGGVLDSIAISPDRKLLACGESAGQIQVWSLEDGTLLARHQIDGIEPKLWFSSKGHVVQIIDFSASTLTPNMWWLQLEGWAN